MSRISGAIAAASLAVWCLAASQTDPAASPVQMIGYHVPTRHVWILIDQAEKMLPAAQIRQIVCFAAYDHDRQAWSWPPEHTTYTVQSGVGKTRKVLVEGTIRDCTQQEAISPWPRGAPTHPFAHSVPEHQQE